MTSLNIRHSTITFILIASAMTPFCISHAQTPVPSRSIQHPGDKKLTLPEFSDNETASELLLPPLDMVDKGKNISAQLRIFVKKFKLKGNTIFSDEELGKITTSYIGRVISSAELQQLRHTLTLYYINQGYINSGVIIPDQKITNNEIKYYSAFHFVCFSIAKFLR